MPPQRIYVDKGLTGTNRARPGLDKAMAAVRTGDTRVVPKLDRLARPVPDARKIAEELQDKGIKLALGRTIHDPDGPGQDVLQHSGHLRGVGGIPDPDAHT